MAYESESKFFGYVKIEVLTHYPPQWTWKVCKHITDSPVVVAEAPLSSSESAWDAGRKALIALEQGRTEEMVGSIALVAPHSFRPTAHHGSLT
jgi:hypothetical protein